MPEIMDPEDELRAAVESAISYECSHTGPVQPGLDSGCRDCYELAKQTAAELFAQGYRKVPQ